MSNKNKKVFSGEQVSNILEGCVHFPLFISDCPDVDIFEADIFSALWVSDLGEDVTPGIPEDLEIVRELPNGQRTYARYALVDSYTSFKKEEYDIPPEMN